MNRTNEFMSLGIPSICEGHPRRDVLAHTYCERTADISFRLVERKAAPMSGRTVGHQRQSSTAPLKFGSRSSPYLHVSQGASSARLPIASQYKETLPDTGSP